MNVKAFKGPDKRRTGNSTYALTQLQERHHEILRLVALGLKNTQVADRLNITPQTVSNVINTPLAQAKLRLLRNRRDSQTVNVAEKIKDLEPVAVGVLEECLTGDDVPYPVKAKVADLVLGDYGGRKKAPQQQRPLVTRHLAEIRERAKDSGYLVVTEKEKIEDAEFEDVSGNPDSHDPADGGGNGRGSESESGLSEGGQEGDF